MTAVTSYPAHVQRAGKTTNDGRSKTSMKTTRKPKRTVQQVVLSVTGVVVSQRTSRNPTARPVGADRTVTQCDSNFWSINAAPVYCGSNGFYHQDSILYGSHVSRKRKLDYARGVLFDPMADFPPSKKNNKKIEPLYTFDRGIYPGNMWHNAGSV